MVQQDAARVHASREAEQRSAHIASQLPLVHRSGKWSEIVADQALRPTDKPSPEEQVLGLSQTVRRILVEQEALLRLVPKALLAAVQVIGPAQSLSIEVAGTILAQVEAA